MSRVFLKPSDLSLVKLQSCSSGDEAYTSYYSDADYPVTKVLREPVYVEVRIMERTDPNIVLILGHCWATSTPVHSVSPSGTFWLMGECTASLHPVVYWEAFLFTSFLFRCPYQDDRYLTTLVPVTGSSGLQFPNPLQALCCEDVHICRSSLTGSSAGNCIYSHPLPLFQFQLS